MRANDDFIARLNRVPPEHSLRRAEVKRAMYSLRFDSSWESFYALRARNHKQNYQNDHLEEKDLQITLSCHYFWLEFALFVYLSCRILFCSRFPCQNERSFPRRRIFGHDLSQVAFF